MSKIKLKELSSSQKANIRSVENSGEYGVVLNMYSGPTLYVQDATAKLKNSDVVLLSDNQEVILFPGHVSEIVSEKIKSSKSIAKIFITFLIIAFGLLFYISIILAKDYHAVIVSYVTGVFSGLTSAVIYDIYKAKRHVIFESDKKTNP